MANRLGELGSQMPVADQEAAQRAEAARLIGLQSQLGQVTAEQAATAGPGLAQQVGAEQVAQAGQDALRVGQAQAGETVAQAGRDFASNQIAEQERRIIEQEAAEVKRMDQEARLAGLGRDIKEKIIDRRRRFDTSEGEARFATQEQLMDYTIANAKKDEDFADYASTVEIALNKDLQMMNEAYAQFEQKERQMLASGEAELNRESLTRIRAKKAWLAEQKRKTEAKAAKHGKLMRAGKFVVGAAITAVSVFATGASGGTLTPLGAAGSATGIGLMTSAVEGEK